MVLLGLLGGLILNIMPCVLPVLSIKLFGLLQHSGEDRRIIARDALASAAGIVVSFIIGGGIAILAKAAGAAVGWGVQFQDPRFVALLAVIVTFFALNLWGVFEITLPPALAHLGAVSREDEGAASYFVSGMFATLLATPCSAPFLGTAMGFALSQSTGMTLAIFSAAGIGMAIPYLCLAVFPHALHWLPKPGVWMLHVRVVLGFFLAATVVWLGYVLAAQVDAVGLTYFYLGLLSIGFLSWLKELLITSRARGSRPLRWTIWALMAVLVLGMMHSVEAHRQSSPASSASGGGLLAWRAFDTQEIARELRAGHSVFVDVTADWCFTCKVNEKTVLETAPIVRALQERGVVLMRADWTNRNPVIGDFLKSFNRYGIPFYVFYKPGQKPIVLSEFLTKGKVLKALGL